MIPTISSWYIADLSKAQGKQELFTHQSPQKLRILREHALIESAVSSNRIEGINIDQSRIRTVVFGKTLLKDRDEEEVRGHRDALRLVHEKAGFVECLGRGPGRFGRKGVIPLKKGIKEGNKSYGTNT